jgi:hypothetical protein
VSGFHELSIGGDDGEATLEWNENTDSGRVLHLRDTYTEAQGRTYALVFVAAQEDWSGAQRTFDAIEQTFRVP